MKKTKEIREKSKKIEEEKEESKGARKNNDYRETNKNRNKREEMSLVQPAHHCLTSSSLAIATPGKLLFSPSLNFNYSPLVANVRE